MRKRSWRRVGHTRGTVTGRIIVSVVVAATGIVFFIAAVTDRTSRWTAYIWPALSVFIAWRFVMLGLYVGEWGVRISNPVFTWWYPWQRVDRFELASTGEMFAPKAKAIALVTTKGRTRRSWDLTTSGLLIKLSPDDQAELLTELNGLLDTKRTSAS